MSDSSPSGAVSEGGAASSAHDFATATATVPKDTTTHVHYAPSIDANLAGAAPRGSLSDPAKFPLGRSETGATISPIIRRRTARVGTFRPVDDFQDFEPRPGWHPGSEPGVDPSKPDGGHASMPTLSAPCDITVVDFSDDQLSLQRLDNESLTPFLNQPKPSWAKCRWINVNGLSWDVIQALGRHKNLHKLAIEDIMNTRNRTKAEWYPTHAFIVLTLQKLVHIDQSDSDASDSDEDGASRASGSSRRGARFPRRLLRKLRRAFRNGDDSDLGPSKASDSAELGGYLKSQPTGFSDAPDIGQLRTLQRYHAPPNDVRAQFMEKHSALASRNLAVACEQVSMFITNDNVIISFFELSGRDVEAPIVRRLQTSDTVIRQSCDASMVGQAIIDAIIDLAIPVAGCYGDVIGDLELDVLTSPNLNHTRELYVLITEINKMLAFISPITTLINTLRDHEIDLAHDAAMAKLLDPNHEPIITRLTYTYLGDVLDHSVLITETLNQIKSSADNLIDLIFNTISAYQNKSMQQLTAATIIFLPLTFITGYFGQNFEPFNAIYEDVQLFWKIAIPTVVATVLIVFNEAIYDYWKRMLQRQRISRERKRRSRRSDRKRR